MQQGMEVGKRGSPLKNINHKKHSHIKKKIKLNVIITNKIENLKLARKGKKRIIKMNI